MAGEMNRQVFQPSKSKLGDMDAKWMILIAYLGMGVFGFITGASYVAWLIPLIIFFIDKENKFIAFHAMQAFLLGIISTIISIILAIVAVATVTSAALGAAALNPYAIGAGLGAGIAVLVIGVIISIVILVFAILALVHGYKYEIYEIPLIGKIAEKIVFKTN